MSTKSWSWWDKLEAKAQSKEKKKAIAQGESNVKLFKDALMADAYQQFYGSSSYSASSGETAYFDSPSSWKPLPSGVWHNPSFSASASKWTNYTQVFPANYETAFASPMTEERAIALNNGTA